MNQFDKQYYLDYGHHNDNIGVVFRHSKLLLESKKTLIVPCGYGQIVLWCVSHGIDCHGVDVSDFIISISQGALKNRLFCSNITNMSLDNKFDLVVCCDLLEHLSEENIDLAIQNILNHLDDNGKAIIKIGVDEIRDFDTDPTHITRKSFFWWHRKIESFGLELYHGLTEIGEAIYIKKSSTLEEFGKSIDIGVDDLPKNICGLKCSRRIDGKLQINLKEHEYVMSMHPSPVYKFLVKNKDINIFDNYDNVIAKIKL